MGGGPDGGLHNPRLPPYPVAEARLRRAVGGA